MHTFSARTITGSRRGKGLGFPTINVHLDDVPSALETGIYASRVMIEESTYSGALHYGPRDMFGDTPSCEVHVLDAEIAKQPEKIDIQIIERIRNVEEFASPEDLSAQIDRDIAQVRAILAPS